MQKRSWEDKALECFGKRAVLKSIARSAGLAQLPQYVVEYIVANHVNDKFPHKDLKRVREDLSRLLPTAEVRETLRAELLRKGEILIFDKMDVRTDLRNGRLVGALTNFGENNVQVPQVMVQRIPRLLTGGVWGSIQLKYRPKKTPRLQAFAMTAFQSAVPDLDEYMAAREQFSTQEWVDLLLASLGYEPDALPSWRVKLVLLSRLIAALESNANVIELGPRQTGKTYLLRNVSSSTYTASGANVTAATMFANMNSGALGILPTYKVVVLDEIADTKIDGPDTVSMLKDYMESGQFSRGGRTYPAEASVVMTGNIEVDGAEPDDGYEHLFEPLPILLQDVAFLDRIHAYIPGWELPKISNSSISESHGLVIDYLGQTLQALRSKDFREHCHEIGLPKWFTRRDTVAVEKNTSALLKLIFPHGKWTRDQLQEITDLGVELRIRVRDQLATMAPGEFSSDHAPSSGEKESSIFKVG